MGNPPGSFIWYELVTTDPDSARDFYGAVIGWQITQGAPPAPGAPDYRHILRSDGGSGGGVLRLAEEALAQGARPAWLPYLHVTDVDAAVSAITAEGGRVLMPKMTIEVGSFALVTDPMGAPFYVMTPVPPAGMENMASDVFSPTAEQRVGWNELATDDVPRAKDFYSRHFGFEFNNSMPMGPLGDYWFIDHHGQTLGAIMQRPEQVPVGMWRLYFRVPDIDAARSAVIAGGGQAITEPHQVPGGDWVFHAFDPQGAFFGLVGGKGS